MNKAIFLDKDGTLISNVPYNINPALIELEEDVINGLKVLQREGFMFIVVSNQSGIAFGYFSEKDLIAVKKKTKELLEKENIRLNGFYYCPHHPAGKVKKYAVPCDCRKPAPGMLLHAAETFNIDLSQSWMMGDILNDVEAGNRVGCRTILIDNGHETEWEINERRVPHLIAKSINEAADMILIADEILLPENEISMLGFT